jgi:hypothetical protein
MRFSALYKLSSKLHNVSYLSRERVKSTFLEDFRDLLTKNFPSDRISFDWHDQSNDPDGKYLVDCKLNGSIPRPYYVFALPGDDKARDATIALLNFERWHHFFHSVAIFEDQEQINRKVCLVSVISARSSSPVSVRTVIAF